MSETLDFNRLCKACEQKARNERKNEDRPYAIIRNRAETRAQLLGVSTDFVWWNLNWRALVPVMRAMLSPEGLCLNCGHGFINERDIQIDHIEPTAGVQDYALEHARNLRLLCQSCNGTKHKKPNLPWLREQESARLSNEHYRDASSLLPSTDGDAWLPGLEPEED